MSGAHPGSTGQTPTRARFVIMLLLFATVVLNYLDRANLSIAAPLLAKDLAIDPLKMGVVFSAFGWTYALCQIPGGWLVDRQHPRRFYAIAILLWSIATLAMGFAWGLTALFLLRLAVGALEAPSFPINNRVVTTWFPERERATAIGFYTSGQFVGLAFLTPVLAYLQTNYGWKTVFLVTGTIGIAWAAVWYTVYRDPKAFKGANEAEIEVIRNGGGLVDLSERSSAKQKSAFVMRDLGKVLSSRKLWGVYFGQRLIPLAPHPRGMVEHITNNDHAEVPRCPIFRARCWNSSAGFPMTPPARPIWRRRAGRKVSSVPSAAVCGPAC